eukprot:gnl/TRDRNA2_/TRDRNA2_164991_c0_seq1.p1 gnl/TRDRNA2_/TRDRNA2_164991_c0~~gnl/TRDRNA2_/TRDRNA2_164991_c0_seq1.p1  ORF type:complete len:298 (-),score=49.22 gnl/TRDRNA2_/TRDRNA2_164991_c0_seq1:40-933(-)
MRMRGGKVMRSTSVESCSKAAQFEGADFSTTAWAFSVLESDREAVRSTITREVVKEADSLGAQQLGTLADLELSCHKAVAARLRDTVCRFFARLPQGHDAFRRGLYAQLVDEFEVDNFGTVGDRQLLDSMGIREGPAEFAAKAAKLVVDYQELRPDTWWRSEGLLHSRVVSYAEYELVVQSGQVLDGCRGRFQQNGYHGSRHSQQWIVATPLPFNRNVDRSLCSENQLLSALCQELAGEEQGMSTAAFAQTTGFLRLFVTGAPCLSCVGAMWQFRLLAPSVVFEVSIGKELEIDAMQ